MSLSFDIKIHLTENETIESFSRYLESKGWKILTQTFDRNHGIDLVAKNDSETLFVEAKGARGNPTDPNVKRKKFDSGQIKDHLGKAIVKTLETRADSNHIAGNKRFLILHPDTPEIRKIINPIESDLLSVEIEIAYVNANGGCDWKMKRQK